MAKKRVKVTKPIPPPVEINKKENICFSFEYLQEFSFTSAEKDGKFFIEFLKRLKKLCCLTWTEIAKSERHAFGFETIKVSSLKQSAMNKMNNYPDITKLYSFRAMGDNHVFLGYRQGQIFEVLFIEYAFNDVYQH